MARFTDRAVDFWDAIERLAEDQSQWSQETFGDDRNRSPVGAFKHLAKETIEAEQAFTEHGAASLELEEELADCFLLLLDAARRSGIGTKDLMSTVERLVEVSAEKMVVNKSRTWPKPTSDEPVEHNQI